MKLFHLLGFTKELVFGSSTSVTRFNPVFLCVFFWIDVTFLRNQQEQPVTLLITFSRGCILLE